MLSDINISAPEIDKCLSVETTNHRESSFTDGDKESDGTIESITPLIIVPVTFWQVIKEWGHIWL